MIEIARISRRSVLSATAACFALPLLEAQDDSAQYGLGAIIDGSAMAPIPPGEFSMGSPNGLADERPVHRVRISKGFEMGKYEVTQAQWETVMTNAHGKPDIPIVTPDGAKVSNRPGRFKGASLPVENVSWDDVQLFLTRLNARDTKHVYRLPTEAEWEYACKVGSDAGSLGARAWYKANSGEETHPVGTKDANALGLFDMYGNVAEWVQDWYSPGYYGQSPEADPAGPETTPETGGYRVFRGSCWFHETDYCRAAMRHFDFPISRFDYVGFRLVRTAR